MVKNVISKMPNACVKEKWNSCAWCSLRRRPFHRYGYTLPEHRSKGLAKAAAAFYVSKFIDRKEGTLPYCYIVDGNEASVKVFRDHLALRRSSIPSGQASMF